MPLSADAIANHPSFLSLLRRQSGVMLEAYEGDPRLSANFASQQRWLLGHLAASLHFRHNIGPKSNGVPISRFIDEAQVHRIASRNTADAFIKELVHYRYVRLVSRASDKRQRLLVATEQPVNALTGWAILHLATLDELDRGKRLATFSAYPDAIARLQPLIADGLLTLEAVRRPSGTFSLFTWLDKGGIVLERMIVGLNEAEQGADRISTSLMSISDMADWLRLSRSHLSRKLREAEAMGSIGWDGRRFHSAMWLSAKFLHEIIAAQSAKLAVIDEAYDKAFGLAPVLASSGK